jgi:hypothetical protein
MYKYAAQILCYAIVRNLDSFDSISSTASAATPISDRIAVRYPPIHLQLRLLTHPPPLLPISPIPHIRVPLLARDQMIQIPRIHQLGPHLLQRPDPTIPHRHLQLIPHNLQQMLHPRLAIRRRVQHRPAQPDGRGAQGEAFEDVGAAADAAVDEDGERFFAGGEDAREAPVAFKQGQDGRGGGVEIASAMVGEHDALEPIIEGELDVVGGHDAL